jgi:hypothetical protein
MEDSLKDFVNDSNKAIYELKELSEYRQGLYVVIR